MRRSKIMSSGAIRHRKLAISEDSDIDKNSDTTAEKNRTVIGTPLKSVPYRMTIFGFGVIAGMLSFFICASFKSSELALVEGRTSLAYHDLRRSSAVYPDSLGGEAVGGYDSFKSESSTNFKLSQFAPSLDDRSMPEMSSSKVSSASSQNSFDGSLGKQLIDSIDQNIDDVMKNNSNGTSRMLVHNGNIAMKTWYGTLDEQVDKIQSLMQKHNGYIERKSFYSSQQYRNSDGYPEHNDDVKILRGARLKIRIPNDKFFDIVHTIQYEIAESSNMITNIDTSSVDVTEQYVDVMTRADVLDASRLALKNLLLNKAESVSDILEVQKEIDRLTSDIESYRSRGQTLRNQSVSLPTLIMRALVI
jgi:Domain of unknown function (DUF4349)